ncbi:MAG: LPS export ABC transporter periplasmic protein LptC [Paracoccaceae bacterium]|nr:LPS export ABC transporter periplasmic protein LptC [Paracoccaceae bacterium]
MLRRENLHSTVVTWLKVVLPLLALAILSTLFLVARTIDPSDAIPYAQVDIDARIKEPRLTLPTWAGVTSDGAALEISASEARPQQGDAAGATAAAIVARLDTPDGGHTDLVAATGLLDQTARLLTVTGDVIITMSSGYQITTEAMTAQLDQTGLKSEVPVTGTGPLGRIDAGAMELSEDPDLAGSYLLVFTNGVKLLYEPKK